jgi:hypothetical protein
MKTIFAMMLAGAFLLSQPAFAGGEEPKDKAAKGDKKDTKKEEPKKEEAKKEKGGW